jgi:hypothetical protein
MFRVWKSPIKRYISSDNRYTISGKCPSFESRKDDFEPAFLAVIESLRKFEPSNLKPRARRYRQTVTEVVRSWKPRSDGPRWMKTVTDHNVDRISDGGARCWRFRRKARPNTPDLRNGDSPTVSPERVRLIGFRAWKEFGQASDKIWNSPNLATFILSPATFFHGKVALIHETVTAISVKSNG